MMSNLKNNKLVIVFVVVLMIILIGGYFKLSKSGIISNSRNIASNPVDVTIGDSYNGQQYFNRGTVLTLNANFKIKDTSKKYYFMWRTYFNGGLNVSTDCRSIPTGVWHPTLSIYGARNATITIYNDSKCKNQVKVFDSKKYLCNNCPSTFTVEYNANGGKGSMSSTSVTYGKSTALRKNTFTNGNLKFTGWTVFNKSRQKWSCYTDSKHSSSSYNDRSVCEKYGYVPYKDGQNIAKTVLPGETAVMYAQWENSSSSNNKKTFVVEYNANGGKGSMSSSNITYGVSQKLRKNAFTKTNYYFLGWRAYNVNRNEWACYTDSKRSDYGYAPKSTCEKYGYALYANEQSISKTARVGEKIIMYAKWQYNFKQGLKKFSGFEKDPSSGSVKATVWPVIKLNIRSSANSTSKILGTVKQGAALRVLDMTNKTNHSKSYVKISYGGVTGWIDGEYVMINLPDVIPSMIYDITNAYSSMYKNKSNYISNVTGKNLYGSNYTWYKYNPRLGYKEYLAPMRLPSAKKLQEAQTNALKYGNKIKIYDAFRPWSIQMVVKNNLKDSNFKGTRYCVTNKFLSSKNSNGSTRCLYEYKGWFIALKLSSHNVGKAVDVSIVSSDDNADIPTQTAMHELSGWAVPTDAKVNQYPGEIAMNSLFTNAGFNYLISEWWHFEDVRASVSGLENLGKDNKANHLELAK